MENYKIKKDNDDKNISLKLNGLFEKMVDKTNKSIEATRLNSDYNKEMYKESMIGHRISRLQNNKNRVSHMVSNKAISFSSIVD
jgi:hypothetical protein